MKLVFKIAFFFFLMFVVSVKADDKLQFFSDDNFPPYSYADPKGRPCGLDVDIFNELCLRLDLNAGVELVPFKRVLREVEAGPAAGALGIFFTEERENYAEFLYDFPIHRSDFFLYSVKEKKFPFRGIKDLYGKKVGKNLGFFISDEFDKAVRDRKISVHEVERTEAMIKMLQCGRIDCFIGNRSCIKYYLKKMKIGNIVPLAGSVCFSRNAYIILSKKNKGARELKGRIAAEYRRMERDGTIKRIKDYYEQ